MGAPSRTARLREELPELLEAIKRGRVPAWARLPMAEYLQLSLEASRGRAEAAAQRSAERWAANHERVREALGSAPLNHRLGGLVAVVGKRLGKDTLRARAIRAHLLALRAESCVAEPKRQRNRGTVSNDTINAKGI